MTALAISLLSLMSYSSPKEGFIVYYLLILIIIYIWFVLFNWVILNLAYTSMHSSSKRFISLVLGFIPITIIALSTINDLSMVDLCLSVSVPTVVAWYGVKRKLFY